MSKDTNESRGSMSRNPYRSASGTSGASHGSAPRRPQPDPSMGMAGRRTQTQRPSTQQHRTPTQRNSVRQAQPVNDAPFEDQPGALDFLRQPKTPAIILAAVLLIAALIVFFVLRGQGGAPVAEPTPEPTAEATATPEPTEAPTPEPTAATAAIANPERAAYRPQPQREGWLPVFKKAETEEKIIAITVDDCFQGENLRKIVQCAIDNGGKVTIFPIGQQARKATQSEVIKYAWENGMEIENHTMTHNGLYKGDDAELAYEIFGQNMVISKILGVDYHQHFLRPRGGDAKDDQRIHAYLMQRGTFYGVAHWSFSGSGSSIDALKNQIAPGLIYLFHTTDKDLNKLLEFIPYATQQGYQLVTMNEMFGYPENEYTELTDDPITRAVPPLEPYETVLVSLKKGRYAWAVNRLQQRLIELGYLESGSNDGCYGNGTAKAVYMFQTNAGVEATGVADVNTQQLLYSDQAPKAQ